MLKSNEQPEILIEKLLNEKKRKENEIARNENSISYGYGRSYESELESNRYNNDREASERVAHLSPINERLRAEVKEIDSKIATL